MPSADPFLADQVFDLVAQIGDRVTDVEGVVPEVLAGDLPALREVERLLDRIVDHSESVTRITLSD